MKFLWVSRQKSWRYFLCGVFLSCIAGECLLKCTNSKKTLLPQEVPGYVLGFSLLLLIAIICCFLWDFANIFYNFYFLFIYLFFSLFLTFRTFLEVIFLLSISSKLKSQYLDFYGFYKGYYFQEKVVYRNTAIIKLKNVLVMVQNNLYKDVFRLNHIVVILIMGWFSRELI